MIPAIAHCQRPSFLARSPPRTMMILKSLAASLLAALTFSSCALESEKAAARAKAAAEEEAARKAAAAAEALKNPPPVVIKEQLPTSPIKKKTKALDFAAPDTTKELIITGATYCLPSLAHAPVTDIQSRLGIFYDLPPTRNVM